MVETVLDSQLCDIFASDAEAVVGDSLLTTLGMRNRKARRLFFNVMNQCAPNGVYLPLDSCVNGFTAVTRCSGDYGSGSTKLGQASSDCLGFNFYAEAREIAVNSNDEDDGFVVT